MFKKRVYWFLSLLVLSLFFGNASWALELAPGLTKDEALSQQALGLAKQQFTTVKGQLTAMAAALPPDQQMAINNAIAVLDQKLAALDRIEVYFAAEAAPGAAFQDVYNFYKGKLTLQDIASAEIEFAVMQVPPGMVPETTQQALTSLSQQNKAKAAIGGSGKSRVSILTVYVNPTTFAVIEKTTVVIATDK